VFHLNLQLPFHHQYANVAQHNPTSASKISPRFSLPAFPCKISSPFDEQVSLERSHLLDLAIELLGHVRFVCQLLLQLIPRVV